MANYINTLQEAVKEHHADKERAIETINCFMNYLQSSKFWNDTTIQVVEVARLLHNIKSELDVDRYEPDCIQKIQS